MLKIIECDDGCATCTEAGSCTIACSANCDTCLADLTCTKATDGYYLDSDSNT